MSDELRLVLAFDTDEPEFTRGFEAGRVWETLTSWSEPLEVTVRAANAEMMLRIAEALGREVLAQPALAPEGDQVTAARGETMPGHGDDLTPDQRAAIDDEWMRVRFGPAPATTEGDVP